MPLTDGLRIWPLIASIVLLEGSGCTKNRSAELAETPRPAIRLLDLDGSTFDLLKRQAGSITVAVFTRSDCPVSNRFAPEIKRLYDAYHPQGVAFYLVYLDPLEDAESIRRHLQEFDYPCQGLRDTEHSLVAYCGAKNTPEAAVIDRNSDVAYVGRINDLYTEIGSARPEPTTYDLADAVEATLAGKPVASARTEAIGCPIADLAD